ncbi:uncharacterized protein LOC120354085 [Nilaparvata lugens]|uniref:uncharacterized protein LOC120354085 n=1 Tax=Nilaparvata lugens TaxID=108931 RepID=UPI00193E3F9B|nr:uncharacterized protein LOC120354085 [Nilaparvata lugens]XP_039296250.1 uncharacterized protein LOC120354085 [Nilaparvata lugens]XP_039296251.1 uncharacterized protein LOC120354085 [Nilaparvata lugens]XP_039296252.1 uncharacterized protein LOC120354085 [Nilaparvata lugens]
MLQLRINLIYLTVSLLAILMYISSTEAYSEAEYKEMFGIIDMDSDGFITEEDLIEFMASDKSKIINTDHGAFATNFLRAIKDCQESKMDFSSFFGFINKKDNKDLATRMNDVRKKFPRKQKVSREDLCETLQLDANQFPKQEYTIHEIANMYLI